MKVIAPLLFLLLSVLCFANKYDGNENDFGNIKGQVTTNDNKPAAAVTVQIKGINKSTTTNEDGSLSITNYLSAHIRLR